MPTQAEILKDLKAHLKDGADWSEFALPLNGATIIRTQATKKNPPKLALVINPNNKRKGRYLWTLEEFVKLYDNLTANQEAYLKLLKAISKINGTEGSKIVVENGSKWETV